MYQTIIDESFTLIIIVMRFVGLYTPKNSKFLSKVRAYLIYFILLVLVNVFIFIKLLSRKNLSEITAMNSMVTYSATTVAFCFKFIPFFKNGQRIRKCIYFFGKNRFAPRNDVEKNITDECISICRRNTQIYFYGILVAEFAWCLPPFFVKDRRLPLDIWLPYDPASSYLTYYFALTLTIAACFYTGVAGSITDPLIGGLAYHTTCQLKILKYNLQHIDKHLESGPIHNENELAEIHFEQVNKHLEHCIHHHNDILNFVSEFEECFSFAIFCQFAGSLFSLCFCVIGLTIVPITSMNGVTYLLSFGVVSFQIFFYCHYGTLLFEENNTVIDAIYMGQWYKYDTMIRKVLLIVMERSKRPMIITAAKVINLTLQTYMSVLKSSYSMTAVMNNYG